jgi:micrococcal nuclease
MTRVRSIVSAMLITALAIAGALGATTYFAANPISLPSATQITSTTPGFYRVTKISDGDTISVDMAGKQESVRMIGVDTPETHKPNTPVQCFGTEASDFTHRMLGGKQVRLEADPTNDDRDRYGRLLRYVYLEDGSLYQKNLIAGGFGFAYTSFPFQKKAEFEQAQADAQAAKRGLWSACKTTREPSGRWQTL